DRTASIHTWLLTTSLCYAPFYSSFAHPHLHSFPTRRSSDLSTDQSAIIQPYSIRCLPPADTVTVFHSYQRSDGLWELFSFYYGRSEEHTSELQSRFDLVCRILLENKNNNILQTISAGTNADH